jgi:5-oxoprolinase (ATP-hydrolysing)
MKLGGTFTDIICICPDDSIRTLKLLSEDPQNYKDAPTEGIRRIIEEFSGNALDSNNLIKTSEIGSIRMGTTVATNALLERKGARVCLVVNEGFKDILYIGNQARPKIFDLNIKKPSNLYEEVVEVNCRVVPARQDCQMQLDTNCRMIQGISNSNYYVVNELNEEVVNSQLIKIFNSGIKSVAIALAHSYSCPEHELKIGEIAKKIGFTTITLSHEAMPMVRLVPRGFTSCAEAYLTPHVDLYLASFRSGFQDNLKGVKVLFMQSDGGLTSMDKFRGARAILSGPAGGVIGFSQTGKRDTELPIIGFDMGGTSTDVSRYDGGNYEHTLESTTAGVTIQAPQLDINTGKN